MSKNLKKVRDEQCGWWVKIFPRRGDGEAKVAAEGGKEEGPRDRVVAVSVRLWFLF